jgi:hypothetical protein
MVLSLASACQGNDGPSGEWGPNSDAQRAGDAGRTSCAAQVWHHLSCNPTTQAGCDFGEKCGYILESEDPFLIRYACVPEGPALPGESCSRGLTGGCGFDDCIAGFHCIENTCARLCNAGPPDSCRQDFEPLGQVPTARPLSPRSTMDSACAGTPAIWPTIKSAMPAPAQTPIARSAKSAWLIPKAKPLSAYLPTQTDFSCGPQAHQAWLCGKTGLRAYGQAETVSEKPLLIRLAPKLEPSIGISASPAVRLPEAAPQ